MKILVVEDHSKIRENIIDFLTIKGHLAEGVSDGLEALRVLNSSYDVIVLDINMPNMGGCEFLESIRKQGVMIPVLVLTALGGINDKIRLFRIGADDYMTKPFDMRELEMRIIALSRRKLSPIETEIIFGDNGEYCLCLEKHSLLFGGKGVELTSKEYAILEFLAKHKGFPKTKTDILEAVWGIREAELNFNSITLEVHISSLRKKLGKSVIVTAKGIGYFIP